MGMLLGALDIGTQTTTLLAGEAADGKLVIVGHVTVPTQGVKKGIIRDIEAVSAGIRKACETMSRDCRIVLADVAASFSCGDIRPVVRTGRVSLLPGHVIDQEDIDAAEENAKTEEAADAPETLLQRFRQKYLVNDQLVVSAAGRDFTGYAAAWEKLGLSLEGIRRDSDVFTALCYITTDQNNNQITGFYPGAMSQPATYTFPNLDPAKDWAIVSPGSETIE